MNCTMRAALPVVSGTKGLRLAGLGASIVGVEITKSEDVGVCYVPERAAESVGQRRGCAAAVRD
jgi:hypothetical protein